MRASRDVLPLIFFLLPHSTCGMFRQFGERHVGLFGLIFMFLSTCICVECCPALRRKDTGRLEGLGSPEINSVAMTGWKYLREGCVKEYIIIFSIHKMLKFSQAFLPQVESEGSYTE